MSQVFNHQGKKLVYQTEKVGQQQWVHVNGHTFCLDLSTKGRTRKSTQVANKNKIVAPMPGKVTKVMVSVSHVIKKGDSLVVMEAMKMEYTLKAEIDGVIKSIAVQTGQQVSLGQVLVEIQ